MLFIIEIINPEKITEDMEINFFARFWGRRDDNL